MKKITMSVAALTIAMMSYGQVNQCIGLTKAIEDCIQMDKEAGITSENNDCLD